MLQDNCSERQCLNALDAEAATCVQGLGIGLPKEAVLRSDIPHAACVAMWLTDLDADSESNVTQTTFQL